MAEMLSPGVFTTEIDASTIVPTVSNSFGVFVGNFVKGDIENYSLITSVDELVSKYGEPTDTNYNDFYQAYNFLQYGNKLYVARAAAETSRNAGVYASDSVGTTVTDYSVAPLLIKNYDDFENTTFVHAGANDKVLFTARTAGEWGNDLSIAVAITADFGNNNDAFDGIGLDNLFEYIPGANEYGIIVKLGTDIVETFTVSFDETVRDYNNKSMFIETVINSQSAYIYVDADGGNANDLDSTINGTPLALVSGLSVAPIAADLTIGYDLFDNKEYIDVDIIIGNELDLGVSAQNLCTERKDCIGFMGIDSSIVGMKAGDATLHIVDARKGVDSNGVSYSTIDNAFKENNMFFVACANYKYQYDRYNDKNRWINIAGDIAGLRAQTSTNRASWWASAGLERGQIKNIKKLAFNPTQGNRDLLYKNGLNPIVSFPGQGTVCWGQKTLLDKPSSFDRVNVRGLFNTMERALAKMAKYQVMEFNDNFTRNRIVSMIKPYLGSVQAGRGIQDFLVICDESNNTADIISRNQLVVDIYIKPTYVAEFVHLKFTNAGTNSFSEVIGG